MSEPVVRCGWRALAGDALYEAYHDTEWGVPERDPRALWEKLVLDGFQAGLSWITILRKREAFRRAFEGPAPDPGTEVLAGKLRAGEVLSGQPGRAMALLRLDRIEGAALTVDGRAVRAEPPKWLAGS